MSRGLNSAERGARGVDALPMDRIYPLLQPGPVVLLTTSRDGQANIMCLSWHMMLDRSPPYIACVVPQEDASFSALRSTRDCVLAVPAAVLADKVEALAALPPRAPDRFEASGFTARPAESVTSPLVEECFVNLECRVTDTRLVSQYNLFILEPIKAWCDPAQGWPATIAPRLAPAAPPPAVAAHLESGLF